MNSMQNHFEITKYTDGSARLELTLNQNMVSRVIDLLNVEIEFLQAGGQMLKNGQLYTSFMVYGAEKVEYLLKAGALFIAMAQQDMGQN